MIERSRRTTVLIIGRHDDPHTEAVSAHLLQMGLQVRCFNSFRCDSIQISISRDDQDRSIAHFLGDTDPDQIRSVWLRQKPVVPLANWSPLEHDASRFSQGEWRNVVQSLEEFIPGAHWINSPESQRKFNYKPSQLLLAKTVGFLVPDTKITNDPLVVRELIGRHKRVIYKSLSGYIFSDQTGIMTSEVTPEHIQNEDCSIRRTPGIFQEFISKAFEVRVTTVGKMSFAARIETPRNGPANIDWRHAQFEDVFRKYELPPEVEEKIKIYLDQSGLTYGAFDFIVTPSGEWYFLECNPAGQFLWLENSLGLPISRAIAEDLARGR